MKALKISSIIVFVAAILGILYTHIYPPHSGLQSFVDSNDSLVVKISKINPLLEREYKKINEMVSEIKQEKLKSSPKTTSSMLKKIDLVIQKMVEVDQAVRNLSSLDQSSFDMLSKTWTEVDTRNTQNIKSLLAICDTNWFTISQFGATCENNAWLLVQHADHDPVFQAEVLATLETLLATKETNLRNYAYLYDRVAVGNGKLQKYGTQFTLVEERLEPYPIEDPKKVDNRRATLGLNSMEEYKKIIEKEYLKDTSVSPSHSTADSS